MIMDTKRRVWERRQGGRLHSHVALWMVRSSGPGYCSQVAGLRKCRITTPGLVELQKLPIASRWCWSPGGKRPFSATGGNADSPALPGGGGKGIENLGALERRGRGCKNETARGVAPDCGRWLLLQTPCRRNHGQGAEPAVWRSWGMDPPPRTDDSLSSAVPDRVTFHGDVRVHPNQQGPGARPARHEPRDPAPRPARGRRPGAQHSPTSTNSKT